MQWTSDEERSKGPPRISWKYTLWKDIDTHGSTREDVCFKAMDVKEQQMFIE